MATFNPVRLHPVRISPYTLRRRLRILTTLLFLNSTFPINASDLAGGHSAPLPVFNLDFETQIPAFWDKPPRVLRSPVWEWTEKGEKRLVWHTGARQVSHIVMDVTGELPRLVLLVSPTGPERWKSVNAALFISMQKSTEIYFWAEKLDRYLRAGGFISLYVDGSRIEELVFRDTGIRHVFPTPNSPSMPK